MAYYLLNKEFNTPLAYPDDITYIECVATSESRHAERCLYRTVSVCYEKLPYRQYILDVADTNHVPYRLYKKLGFQSLIEKMKNIPKIKGLNQRIYMNWSK